MGTIGVVDDDVVDASNLQRQVVHGVADVGRPKTESAAETVAAINPLVTVVRHDLRLTSDERPRASSPTTTSSSTAPTTSRRATSSTTPACCSGMPHVWGSIYRFDGQVSVWFAGHGPCYRCVFPDPPPPDAVPSCATGGVLGVLCAAIGSVQVAEAIKLIVGQGDPLVGRLLVHDALRQTWDTLTGPRRPRTARVCGESPTVTSLVDYEAVLRSAAVRRSRPSAAAAGAGGVRRGLGDASWRTCSAPGTAARESFELVDVREPGERAVVVDPGRPRHPPRASSAHGTAAGELPDGIPVVVLCKSGVRSAEAARLLSAAGRADVAQPPGGVLAWVHDVDPCLPVY